MGNKLKKSHRRRDTKLQTQVKDEFLEIDYSAVHYDLDLVMGLIKYTIDQVSHLDQRAVLIEGLCNSNKLIFDDDKLEIRFMDELFALEKRIGEVVAVISL